MSNPPSRIAIHAELIPCPKHLMFDQGCWECFDMTELGMFYARGVLDPQEYLKAVRQHPLLFKRFRELTQEIYDCREPYKAWELVNEVWLALDNAYEKHPADLVLVASRSAMHACSNAMPVIEEHAKQDPAFLASRKLVKKARKLVASGVEFPNGPLHLEGDA